GLFEAEHESQERAFKYAMEKMNLRNVVGPNKLLIYHVEHITPHDSFEASKEICKQIKEGIAAVFGPITNIPRAHVQSICNAFEIPHLQAQWDPRDPRDYFSISVYPHYSSLSTAYSDLIRYWGWKRFTVIYEDNEGLIRLQEVLKATEGKDVQVTVRKLNPLTNSYVNMFKDIKETGESHIVVDCDVKKVKDVLHEALKVNMVSEYYHYLFITLDLGLVDLEDYKYGGANITAMRLIDPLRRQVIDVMSDWRLEEARSGKSPLMGQKEIQTETALMYDAVHLFTKGLSELAQAQVVTTEPLNCNKRQTWTNGNSLLNYMKSMDFEGLSGRLRFENGKRTDFELDILELSTSGLQKVGTWNPKMKVNITKTYQEKKKEIKESLKNQTLRVVTVVEAPYAVYSTESGGPRFEGFVIDLLDLIAHKLGFNYTVYVAPDGKYGAKVDDKGNWNGMVGELIGNKDGPRADLAAAGMTITYEREKVVDFTKPFLNLGITILYRKPKKAPPELFSFLSPLSIDVWVYMMAAYLCVSFMLFVIARFSPYEWCNAHPCNVDSDVVENQFSILNSLWFTIGSLMQQGCEISPRAVSTRLVSTIWWFFTLIMISSYTANLAAFLTVERMESAIGSAQDLAEQTKIKYGTLNSGSTKAFFQDSDIPLYKRMWSFMNSEEPSVFVNSTEEAIQRVKSGDYAYMGESSSIDYAVQRNCELMSVGGLLDSKGYGIATPRDSPYTEIISNEIIHFHENQEIQKLYTKWWVEKSGGKCLVDDKKKDASALGITNVGGVFVVLVGGLCFGFLIAMCEFIWKARKNASEDRQSICSEMAEEFRFAIRCFGSSKKSSKRKPSKDITDNGLQFMPLTRIPADGPVGPRELYA
ncbi:hypothetical protein ACJMK2_028806, partial [Sinanodonta woodiana]